MTLLNERQRAMLAEMGIKVWVPHAKSAPGSITGGAKEPLNKSARAGAPGFGRECEAQSAAIPRGAGSIRNDEQARFDGMSERDGRVHPLSDIEPRPAGIESMGWPELQAAVADCRACGLCAGRTQTVFGVGSRTADWMVVGEAPGEQEDRQGHPFVGSAGKLLDNMLAAIGLSRQAELELEDETGAANATAPETSAKHGVYIANVLKCRPPGNRNPQPAEVTQCEPYLRRQVALVKPRIILAMGRFAVQSLLQTTEPIGRLRARVHHYEGVPVIVTYHPAYLLRALTEKAKAWQDLCLAMKTATGVPDRV
ncbi:MAG: uracil-DNA glycosylase [Burkholderiaceae bacterium]|jgi:DNA polymerase|nr:uracil-DNA glycosylase [Burkholderiaceae bacterium]